MSAFSFNRDFDFIQGDELDLRIICHAEASGAELPFYWFDILLHGAGAPVGKISVRIGSNYHSRWNGHIGYEIDSPHRGHGYAGKAARMALNVAHFHGMDHVLLTCDADNAASSRTIERLGGRLMEITKPPKDYFAYYDGIPPHRIYILTL